MYDVYNLIDQIFGARNNFKQMYSEKSTDSNFGVVKRQNKFFGARNNFKQMYSEKP